MSLKDLYIQIDSLKLVVQKLSFYILSIYLKSLAQKNIYLRLYLKNLSREFLSKEYTFNFEIEYGNHKQTSQLVRFFLFRTKLYMCKKNVIINLSFTMGQKGFYNA